MKNPIITLTLAVIDILLLVVIIVPFDARYQEYDEDKPEIPTEDVSSTIPLIEPEGNDESVVVAEEEKSTTGKTDEGSVEVVVSEIEQPLENSGFDASLYDTHELPNIKDFKWVTSDILAGVRPDDAEAIVFEESLGGWKCYIFESETVVEHLANAELTGSVDNLILNIDWYYTRAGEEKDVFEDNSPDSVYKGYADEAGGIYVQGAGAVHLTDIYRIGEHQYAFGSISWPDGIGGRLMLVRP